MGLTNNPTIAAISRAIHNTVIRRYRLLVIIAVELYLITVVVIYIQVLYRLYRVLTIAPYVT